MHIMQERKKERRGEKHQNFHRLGHFWYCTATVQSQFASKLITTVACILEHEHFADLP